MKTDETKTETLQFKVTAKERELIERYAEEEGTTVSRYVRGAVLISMMFDGRPEAIKIVAKEVGEKAFAAIRQRLTGSPREGR